MPPIPCGIIAAVLGYFFGAIPFAYLIVRARKGIDIRTIGSGNVGATNAGRLLGFRYFLLVFALDISKGLLPTLLLPRLAEYLAGTELPSLPVFVALTTILGHNFPIYLRFRGGKGVATSLGALFALDPFASAATASAFLVFVLITRIVSLSSVMAGIVFVLVHFSTTEHPWSRRELAMSVVTIGLLGMLIMRHRANFVRIWQGTEPRISFRKKRNPPGGRVVVAALIPLALLATTGAFVAYKAKQTPTLQCGPLTLATGTRVNTGHQRSERLVFLDNERLLAVACPRYNRVMLYRVNDHTNLELVRDIALEGRPVALCPTDDRLYVLQRPIADARHLEPGYWQTFDFQGQPIGSTFPVGYDPDDMALSADGQTAWVVLSGNAEGETNRPDPELIAVDLDGTEAVVKGRLTFDRPDDDPERITLSARGDVAAVVLLGSNEVASIDLSDPHQPRLAGRSELPALEVPYASALGDDWIMMPVDSDRESVVLNRNDASASPASRFLVTTLPGDSALEVVHAAQHRSLGRLPLHGSFNLGSVIPTGIATAPARGLLAVAERAGGVRLISVRWNHAAIDESPARPLVTALKKPTSSRE